MQIKSIRRRITTTAFAAAALAVLTLVPAAPAQANEIGRIEATLDGAPMAWRTLGPDGSSVEYNTWVRDDFGMTSVSIMGFPPGPVTMRGVLQLTFSMMPGDSGLFEQEVILAPDGMRQIWTAPEGENLITVEQFDAGSAEAMVSGLISGRLCRKDGMFAEPDPDDCRQIEGRFETRLPQSDG